MDSLQERATAGYASSAISDPVFHLDNGVLGGTMTYTWHFDRALGVLKVLLSEVGIDASGLICYFSIEEVSD
jgi:hypothetical protein